MKLLDYIRGLRKGKEAHRLEKESMQDPFLADAMDGYNQVEGNHEQRIEKLRMQVSAHSAKKKNTRAITWSIAACLAPVNTCAFITTLSVPILRYAARTPAAVRHKVCLSTGIPYLEKISFA